MKKISTNETNISSNLEKINNISKYYFKNIYNILFYNEKLKLILGEYFLKKYLKLMLKKMILLK